LKENSLQSCQDIQLCPMDCDSKYAFSINITHNTLQYYLFNFKSKAEVDTAVFKCINPNG